MMRLSHTYLFSVFLLIVLQGCSTSMVRTPVPEDLQGDVTVLGSNDFRTWAYVQVRDIEKDLLESHEQQIAGGMMYDKNGKMRDGNALAISGGGNNGAFTAGLLAGWSETGTRPEFHAVTGISTGGLIAPFAFLGSDYDPILRELYTSVSTEDIAEERPWLSLLSSDSFMEVTGLNDIVAKYVDQALLHAVAREHNRGRRLLIGTTNLDAGLPVIWNMGEIAKSDHPDALSLFRNIMIASASIPLLFPPVYIQVEANGRVYDEMHVDGGATSQVFVYPVRFDFKKIYEREKIERKRYIYIVRNAQLLPKWEAVDPGMVSIGGRSLLTLIKVQGMGDIYRIYWTLQRDQMDFNFAYISDDFKEESNEMFDKDYMTKLYNYGYEKAKHGYPWLKKPPIVD